MTHKLASVLGMTASVINFILACVVLVVGFGTKAAIALFISSFVFAVPCIIDVFLPQNKKEYISPLVWVAVGAITTYCYGYVAMEVLGYKEEMLQQTIDYFEKQDTLKRN